MKYRFHYLADPGSASWVDVGIGEGVTAEEALEKLRATKGLRAGWYRGAPEAVEFLVDSSGVTAVSESLS